MSTLYYMTNLNATEQSDLECLVPLTYREEVLFRAFQNAHATANEQETWIENMQCALRHLAKDDEVVIEHNRISELAKGNW